MADKINKQVKQNQYNYRTKIIELEKEGQYWKQRSEEYKKKFEEAMLSSQYYSSHQLIKKLEDKQNQINCLRQHLLAVERSYSRSNIEVETETEKELKIIIQELKEGAIKAIIEKDNQIQALQRKLKDKAYDRHINELNERYQSLLKMHQESIITHEEQIQKYNDKLIQSRQEFMDKLISLQKQISHSQSIKQILIEKTNNLQGNLVSSQKVIGSYEDKIHELENNLIIEKLKYAQKQSKINMEYEALEQLQKSLEKQCINLQNIIKDYKYKEQRYQDQIESLKQEKQELYIKFQTLKRKDITKLSASMIGPSPDMFTKNVNLFSSFYKFNNNDQSIENDQKSDLREIKELDEQHLIQNFTGYEQIQTQEVQNFHISKRSADNIDNQQLQSMEQEIKELKQKIKELQSKHQTVQSLYNRNKQLQNKQQTLFTRIQQLTKSIKQVTENLQRQRKISTELRQQLKKSIKQSQLIVEMESLKQHMFKIENAFLTQKLKNAERIQYQKQIYQIEKQEWNTQIQQLKQKIVEYEIVKKKKKGVYKH